MLPSIIAKNEEDLLSSWSRQSRIVAQGEPPPFRVDGLVFGVRRDASGLLELSVDSERSLMSHGRRWPTRHGCCWRRCWCWCICRWP